MSTAGWRRLIERRQAPDGGACTQREFVAEFGALDEWDAAPPVEQAEAVAEAEAEVDVDVDAPALAPAPAAVPVPVEEAEAVALWLGESGAAVPAAPVMTAEEGVPPPSPAAVHSKRRLERLLEQTRGRPGKPVRSLTPPPLLLLPPPLPICCLSWCISRCAFS